ncbi:NAD-dependent deacetylase [Peptoclostridium litorale DSM 5388]|uniref:NAD-dependent protein deacetylase n=1 Tax=Peptoclostridium litorale DSM 5388 TaxID=1121324 RepID=A0A069RD93_PEPLI|nr:NAD-dependent protein deacylase [Peptoclostridium litorale]KDR94195.1 NAD-dependent protein deacetylase CobB [Peptoclostridium litorale DSM 5388]SIN82124.1 NAD-dependent deacetylase [Peptoclostridium litorale DSM 5388]
MSSVNKLSDMIAESSNIVFFGGAGVSTESQIPDFRSGNGLYKTSNDKSYPPEVMLSHSFFMSHTDEFFEFYKSKMIYGNAQPNMAHISLAKLEKLGKLKAVITQNIDGLHQMAGSQNVLELHGSIHRNYCMGCNLFYDLGYIISSSSNVPRCKKCGAIVKPDVVLYEEGLDMDIVKSAISHIKECDLLIIGGTSLAVYPAAGLVEYFSGSGMVLINKTPTPFDYKADLVISDPIGEVLGKAVENL